MTDEIQNNVVDISDEIAKNEAKAIEGRTHDCDECDCQMLNDGTPEKLPTRRRNPYPGEDNACPDVPLLKAGG